MTRSAPGLVVLYRWRLKPGSEARFCAAWSTVTRILRDERGSLGSRLHHGDDGICYAYAQWPDAEALADAFAQPVDAVASAQMRDLVIEDFAPVRLVPIADLLVTCR